MNPQSLLSGIAAVTIVLAASPVVAAETSSSSSSSFSSSSSPSAEAIRIERCTRFGSGEDYQRCVRLIRRTPPKENVETVDTSAIPDGEWKWTNFLDRIEAKVKVTVKFVSVLSKQFCKDRTAEDGSTGRECMTRVKNELKTRVDAMLDEVFRADLPSAR